MSDHALLTAEEILKKKIKNKKARISKLEKELADLENEYNELIDSNQLKFKINIKK